MIKTQLSLIPDLIPDTDIPLLNKDYNGFTNYETWLFNLFFEDGFNDPDLYNCQDIDSYILILEDHIDSILDNIFKEDKDIKFKEDISFKESIKQSFKERIDFTQLADIYLS